MRTICETYLYEWASKCSFKVYLIFKHAYCHYLSFMYTNWKWEDKFEINGVFISTKSNTSIKSISFIWNLQNRTKSHKLNMLLICFKWKSFRQRIHNHQSRANMLNSHPAWFHIFWSFKYFISMCLLWLSLLLFLVKYATAKLSSK